MFERDLPGANTFGYNTTEVGTLPLETCDTINGSWGFNASDRAFKTSKELIHYLVRAAGSDANLLLNVGPTPEGTFSPEVVERLKEVGAWTRKFGETIYGTRGGPMKPQPWGVMTEKDGSLYLHVLERDAPERLALPGTTALNVSSAKAFASDVAVELSKDRDLEIRLPSRDKRDPVDTIIVLRVKN
jgi:alpha-L-fucosidase